MNISGRQVWLPSVFFEDISLTIMRRPIKVVGKWQAFMRSTNVSKSVFGDSY